jgi:hypothetical protein
MASSYTDLGIEKMATGENAGTWGTKTNTNLDIIEKSIAGYVEQAVTSGGTTALSITDGDATESTSVARHAVIKLTGTITGNSIVTVPDSVEKVYIVTNGTSGAYTVQFKTASGTGITFGVSEKTTRLVYSDGTNLVDAGFGGSLDIEGRELVLDADGDTTITADTDDQIDIKIAGADDFQFTANTFTAQSGSSIVVPESGLTFGSTAITSTAAELNLLDGVSGLIQADFTKLAAVDSTAAELNIVDGGTSATSTTIADADRVVLNDNGTMVQVAVTDLAAYFDDEITAMPNLTSVGTLTTLTVDNVIINGTTIGHTDDTDLITLADGIATVAGEISVTTLDIGGTNVTATAAEINLIDGGASTGTTAVADADGILTNDSGTMRLTTAATFKTYFQSGVTASSVAADDIAAGDAAVTLGNGSTSADVTIDSGDDIVIDAAGGNVEFKDAGTLQLTLDMDGTAGAQVIQLGVDSDDLIFKQYDGTTVLTLDDDTTVKVATDLTVGDDLSLISDSAVLKFGADGDTTLTHTDGTGLTLNSTNKLCFNDATQFIQGASGTVLDIAATDEIELTATLIDVVGNLAGSGTGTFGGILKTDDTTDATSTTDGSLQTDGGLSVAKDTIIGNDLKLLSDSAVLVFGAGSDATLTHTNDTGLTLNSTNKLMFNDASQFIQGSSGTVLSIGATDEIDLTATAIDINGTCDISGTFSLAGTNVTSTATEINKLDGVGTLKEAGKETIWIPANAMTPTESNGCASVTSVETTSGRPDMVVLDFDKDSDEFAQFAVAFPKSWNLGTITFQCFWSGLAATTGVAISLEGVAMNDNETIDVAYGSAVVVTDDAQGAVEELLVTAESGAVTIAGTPADNDLCYFRIGRDVSDGNDDMAGDMRLHGIKIFFTTDAANDA